MKCGLSALELVRPSLLSYGPFGRGFSVLIRSLRHVMRIRIRGLAFRICYFEFSIESRIRDRGRAHDARRTRMLRQIARAAEGCASCPFCIQKWILTYSYRTESDCRSNCRVASEWEIVISGGVRVMHTHTTRHTSRRVVDDSDAA